MKGLGEGGKGKVKKGEIVQPPRKVSNAKQEKSHKSDDHEQDLLKLSFLKMRFCNFAPILPGYKYLNGIGRVSGGLRGVVEVEGGVEVGVEVEVDEYDLTKLAVQKT